MYAYNIIIDYIILQVFKFYCFLILGLETREAIYPKNIAAEIPPAVAEVPPINAPISPNSWTFLIAPLARRFPKPVKGTLAPAPAKSTKY